MSHQPIANGATSKIWRDGVLVDFQDATIHVMSHVVHYGSSVFEGIRCYETPAGGAVFRLREHMRRLADSAKIYRMDLKYSVDELCEAVLDTIVANDLKECYIRPLVARTGQQMGVHPGNAPVETFIICWIWGRYLGAEALEHGVDVRISSWRRAAGSTFPTMAKAGGNYLNSQLTKMEAKVDDYIEGIMLDVNGQVSEGSGETCSSCARACCTRRASGPAFSMASPATRSSSWPETSASRCASRRFRARCCMWRTRCSSAAPRPS